MFCITKLSRTLEYTQLENIKDTVMLVTLLGDDHVAMRLQITKFIIAISRLLGKLGGESADVVR